MAKRRIISNILLGVAFGAAVTLGGCDNHKNKSNEGQPGVAGLKLNIPLDATHSATMGAALPDNMPDYAKVYPGAQVLGVVSMTDMPTAPWTATVQYTTAAKPEAVLAFYKQNAAAAGLNKATNTQIGKMLSYTAKKEGGTEYVTINIAPKDAGTFVQEFYK